MRLPVRSDCTRCDLHENAKSVGIPILWHDRSLAPDQGVPALICLGGAPSHFEDKKGVPWAGPAGGVLMAILEEFLPIASVYYGNIVRCRTGLGDPAPTAKQQKACLPHTQEDIEQVLRVHGDNATIVVMYLGSVATQAALDKTVNSTIQKMQGKRVDFPITRKT